MQYAGEALAQLFPAHMTAFGHDASAAREYILHCTIAGGEHPCVDQLIAVAADKRRMGVIETDDVGSFALG
jgi:hypothetical protein